MNNRRKLLIVLGAATFTPRAAFAQPKKPIPMVGVLTVGTGSIGAGAMPAFREALAARGWKAGVQLNIEEVHALGQLDRLSELAQALAGKRPDVIVAANSLGVKAAAKAAPGTPVVMLIVSDPVNRGFAKSFARPGGLITGIGNVSDETVAKFVELLLTASPGLKRIGFLDTGSYGPMRDSINRSGQQHAVQVSIADAKRREEIEPALAHLAKQGMQALAIVPSPLSTLARKEILQFSAAQRWPVIAITRMWVEDGALLCYGSDSESQWRRAAYFVDRILRGAKPADLPIELPTTFEMGVNLKTAKALGLTMPPEIMVRATRVIE
jgi:putative ABC transport system substrate-binding protein